MYRVRNSFLRCPVKPLELKTTNSKLEGATKKNEATLNNCDDNDGGKKN